MSHYLLSECSIIQFVVSLHRIHVKITVEESVCNKTQPDSVYDSDSVWCLFDVHQPNTKLELLITCLKYLCFPTRGFYKLLEKDKINISMRQNKKIKLFAVISNNKNTWFLVMPISYWVEIEEKYCCGLWQPSSQKDALFYICFLAVVLSFM